MGRGRLAGPKMPFQEMMSNPGRVSAMGGVSGRMLERRAAITASARTLPPLIEGRPEPKSATYICNCPPIKSVSACGLDL